MAYIKYHRENKPATWICHVGKFDTIWFAYHDVFKCLIKFPKLAWRFRHHG